MNPREEKFYSISRVSELTDVPGHILRYWEKEFSYLKPMRDQKGRRIYTAEDIDRISRIKDLVYREGYRIKSAKRKLREQDRPGYSEHRETIKFLRELQKDLQALQDLAKVPY